MEVPVAFTLCDVARRKGFEVPLITVLTLNALTFASDSIHEKLYDEFADLLKYFLVRYPLQDRLELGVECCHRPAPRLLARLRSPSFVRP